MLGCGADVVCMHGYACGYLLLRSAMRATLAKQEMGEEDPERGGPQRDSGVCRVYWKLAKLQQLASARSICGGLLEAFGACLAVSRSAHLRPRRRPYQDLEMKCGRRHAMNIIILLPRGTCEGVTPTRPGPFQPVIWPWTKLQTTGEIHCSPEGWTLP